MTPERSDLGRWYAAPVPAGEARKALAALARRQRPGHPDGYPDSGDGPLALLHRELRLAILTFWARGEEGAGAAAPHFERLRALHREPPDQALLHLAEGQLLVSRRLARGLQHLQRGFHLAAPWLRAGDYLMLLERHGLLAELALGERPCPAVGLDELLQEARVIRRLRPRRPPAGGDPRDTVG